MGKWRLCLAALWMWGRRWHGARVRQAEYGKGLSDFTKINTGTHSSRGGGRGGMEAEAEAEVDS